MLSQFKKYKLIQDYITKTGNDVQKFNAEISDSEIVSVNTRRLTNIGVFRIYAEKYITAHPDINKDMIIMVRQLESTSKGLPLEIYCFSSEKEWLKYENIISDIFDHLFTITSEFELEVFEEPTGNDFRNMNK